MAMFFSEIFELYAEHNALIKKLDESVVKIRSKSMIFYRGFKRSAKPIPWLFPVMELPFEQAFEHALGRPWNNMTSSKLKSIEHSLGKEAASIALEKETREVPTVINLLGAETSETSNIEQVEK